MDGPDTACVILKSRMVPCNRVGLLLLTRYSIRMNARKRIAPTPPRQTVSILLYSLAILDFQVYAYSKGSARQWVSYGRWALAASKIAAVESVAVVSWA